MIGFDCSNIETYAVRPHFLGTCFLDWFGFWMARRRPLPWCHWCFFHVPNTHHQRSKQISVDLWLVACVHSTTFHTGKRLTWYVSVVCFVHVLKLRMMRVVGSLRLLSFLNLPSGCLQCPRVAFLAGVGGRSAPLSCTFDCDPFSNDLH
jgi:hypothetical protein